MKALLCVLTLIIAAAEASACGRCGYSVCRIATSYVAPQPVTYTYPTTNYDQRLQVNYTLTFPPPAVSGSTYYGYTPQAYSFLDPALFVNAASRYLETAQYASSQGFSQFNQSAALVLQHQAGVAEVQARTALLQEAARLVASTAPGSSTVFQLRATRDGGGRLTVEGVSDGTAPPLTAPGPIASNPAEIIRAKCVSCHGAGKQEGGLRLDDLAGLDRSFEVKILDRITTLDPAKRMPRGGTLTAAEISALFKASSLCGGEKR